MRDIFQLTGGYPNTYSNFQKESKMLSLKNSVKLILGYDRKLHAIENWRLFFSQFITGFNWLYCEGVYQEKFEDTIIIESIVWDVSEIVNCVNLANLYRVLELQDSVIVEVTINGVVSYSFIENDNDLESIISQLQSVKIG